MATERTTAPGTIKEVQVVLRAIDKRFADIDQRLDRLEAVARTHDTRLDVVERTTTDLGTRLTTVETTTTDLGTRLTTVETTTTDLEGKVDTVEGKVTPLETTTNVLDARLTTVVGEAEGVKRRVGRLERPHEVELARLVEDLKVFADGVDAGDGFVKTEATEVHGALVALQNRPDDASYHEAWQEALDRMDLLAAFVQAGDDEDARTIEHLLTSARRVAAHALTG